MSLIKRSGGKVDLTKVDLSLKGMLLLIIAFAIILAAFGGGKWLLSKGKGVVQGAMPDSVGTGASDLESQLGI